MKKDTLSLREAAKLLQWAPQTLKKRIKEGTVKASSTGTGRKRRYTIAAKDLPSRNGKGNGAMPERKPKKRGRPAKHQNARSAAAQKAQFISQHFTPADLPSAEMMLRGAFLNWCAEKLLAQ